MEQARSRKHVLRGGEVQRLPLGTELAQIGGVGRIAAHTHDLIAARLHDHATPGAAVRTGGLGLAQQIAHAITRSYTSATQPAGTVSFSERNASRCRRI